MELRRIETHLFLLILCLIKSSSGFEPLSIGIGIGIASLLGYSKDTLIENTVCRMYECCDNRSIPLNFTKLALDLKRNVFGQHIVQGEVIQALRNHYRDGGVRSRKPLVMSFHGTPGTGKNYVADFIVKAIYKEGLKSKFVHKFSGKVDFPNPHKSKEYSIAIRNYIKSAIANCERSLFVFDEVDDMPEGVFDTITSLLDYHESVNGLDFRKAVFIFLSNVGGVEIADTLYDYYSSKHYTRGEVKLHHLEKVLELVAYNKGGGMRKSRPIEQGLIDHFVPFLPLERQHVIKCIEVEFDRIGVRMDEKKKEAMLKFVEFENLFAKNGCKKVTKKAELFL